MFAIDDVLDGALAGIERRPDVAIYDHGERIVGTLDSGAAASVDIGGRTLVIRADDPAGANPWPAIAVAIGALLVGAALAVTLYRLRRSERAASALERAPPTRSDRRHPPRRARSSAHVEPDER